MEDYKYCPQCEKEYFAHIENCAYCELKLLTALELENKKSKEIYVSKEGSGELVVIREGEKGWMNELHCHLTDVGFKSQLLLSEGCIPGKCGATFMVLVPAGDAEAADRAVEKYNHEMHPELKKSSENAEQGLCPACGHEVGADAVECADCGIQLIFVEEE